MERVLVVDDSLDQAHMIAGLLGAASYTTEIARSGSEALEAIAKEPPDLVLTDLKMPGLSGLDLVEEVVRRHPALPVVLMTAHGSGEIALRALQRGAASYLPKRLVVEELVGTVERLLELSRIRRSRAQLLASLVESESRFVLESDPALISPLTSHVEQMIQAQIPTLGENERMRLGLALQEALLNALHHGNLELDSKLRETPGREYFLLVEERCRQNPYCRRRVYLTVGLARNEVVLTVEDEGPGFDVTSVPDPTDASNLLRCSGRGLYLIGTFMDRVEHNAEGNRITMVKLVPQGKPGPGPAVVGEEAARNS